jgi:chromosome segregation ATPase
MNDERDLKTRQAAREDHSVWLSQHAAWATEAEGWLRRLEDHARTLDQLRERLDRERTRIETHIEGIRRHEGAITGHEFLLAELDSGTCGGCEEAEPPAHATAAAAHGQETTVHTRLAERQNQIVARLSLLAELLEQAD